MIESIPIMAMITSGKMISIWGKAKRVISKVCRAAKEGSYN